MDELTPSEFKLFVANAMHGWDSAEHLSNMEAEKVAHLSNKTVCNGQRALREKGYL
jgi:hypothetical protein